MITPSKRDKQKSATKETCPCCADVEKRWLYFFWNYWYCVKCCHSVFGAGPAKIKRTR